MINVEVKIKGEQTWLFTTKQNAACGILQMLTDEERQQIFGKFCVFCGREDPACQCWNDE